ncbi:hypothetical protein Tco_1260257 [Tanacetum coccineum]
MSPTMTTRSDGRPAAASRGGGTGGQAGEGAGRTKGRFGDQDDGRNEGQRGQVGGQGISFERHVGDPQASYWLKYVHMIQGLDQELVIIGWSGLKKEERPESRSFHTSL